MHILKVIIYAKARLDRETEKQIGIINLWWTLDLKNRTYYPGG